MGANEKQNFGQSIDESNNSIDKAKSELSQLQKQIDGFAAGVKYEGQIVDYFNAVVSNPEDLKNDPDGLITYKMYTTAISRKNELQMQIKELQADSIGTKVDKDDTISEDGEARNITKNIDTTNISNKEFLSSVGEGARLKYITKGNVESGKVASGEVKEMIFSFPNKDMYLRTTAGQVLPQEVLKVSVKGEEYTRINNSLKGEFYDKNNNRLKIHGGGFGGEDTNLNVTELRSKEEINKISSEYEETLKNYKGVANKLVAREALEKGINIELFLKVIDRRIENQEDLAKNKPNEFNSRLEQYSTEVLRALSQNKDLNTKEKYSIETSAEIFQRLTPASWEKSLEESGYSTEDISTHKTNTSYNEQSFGKEYKGYLPAEYSAPYESKIKTRANGETYKVTYCSKTARLNLAKFGLYKPDIPQGASATASMNQYPAGRVNSMSRITNIPEGVDVLDIFSRAKGANARANNRGHRAVGFKREGQWFVLDPYTKTPANSKVREKPIPLNMYLNSGRDFKGFVMHESKNGGESNKKSP
ncbi:hypothetical protein LR004_01415, partial [Candidatus Gracilibacteria bacterium]|nr:hypothetical protein [Candidatus Gracilibacteria bacterium]